MCEHRKIFKVFLAILHIMHERVKPIKQMNILDSRYVVLKSFSSPTVSAGNMRQKFSFGAIVLYFLNYLYPPFWIGQVIYFI